MKSNIAALLAGATMLAMTAGAQGQTFEMKVAHFTIAQHPMSVWIQNWADKLAKDSGGRIVPKVFPGAQMGPPPIY